jgi:signal transduction histidine kinase
MVEATDEAWQTEFATREPRSANVIEFPVRRSRDEQLRHELVVALATADDLSSAMPHVVRRIRRRSGAARVEWWAVGDGHALELVTGSGTVTGVRHDVPVNPVGAFVVYGDEFDPCLESCLTSLAPLIRRRAADERLCQTVIRLAQRNEALEDFAALVAHELKSPLQAALAAGDPSYLVEEALDLVDTLLETARNDPREGAAPLAECLDDVAAHLGADVAITAELATALPLPAQPLRVILRNLLANAVAADARHVHVAAVRTSGSCRLVVDDDGVGLDEAGYASGSGVGLSLCRRLAARFGAVVELTPRPAGGTRATLEFAERFG